jgi:hypothetical protein
MSGADPGTLLPGDKIRVITTSHGTVRDVVGWSDLMPAHVLIEGPDGVPFTVPCEDDDTFTRNWQVLGRPCPLGSLWEGPAGVLWVNVGPSLWVLEGGDARLLMPSNGNEIAALVPYDGDAQERNR